MKIPKKKKNPSTMDNMHKRPKQHNEEELKVMTASRELKAMIGYINGNIEMKGQGKEDSMIKSDKVAFKAPKMDPTLEQRKEDRDPIYLCGHC